MWGGGAGERKEETGLKKNSEVSGMSYWTNDGAVYSDEGDLWKPKLDGKKIKSSILDMLSLRYLWDIKVEMSE